jgi:hypothetical protein
VITVNCKVTSQCLPAETEKSKALVSMLVVTANNNNSNTYISRVIIRMIS